MSEMAQILPDRIRQRLQTLGKSPRSVSLKIGAHAGYVRDILDPERFNVPGALRMEALAAELETTTDWLMGRVESPTQPLSEVRIADRRLDWAPQRGTSEPLKILGTGYCADLTIEADGETLKVEQTLFEPGNVVGIVRRPPGISATETSYAIYFHGDSMEPRFYQGELGIVSAARVPGPGDFVLVQLNDGESDEVVTVLVKRLIRSTGAYIELEQFNPALKFRIPRSRVARMHKILSPAEMVAGG